MGLEQRQIDLLISYRDKAYVYAVLCEKSFELFSLIRTLCNIPLILITSVLSIINASDFDPKDMKLPNVIINACVAMIMGLISNFKFPLFLTSIMISIKLGCNCSSALIDTKNIRCCSYFGLNHEKAIIW